MLAWLLPIYYSGVGGVTVDLLVADRCRTRTVGRLRRTLKVVASRALAASCG